MLSDGAESCRGVGLTQLWLPLVERLAKICWVVGEVGDVSDAVAEGHDGKTSLGVVALGDEDIDEVDQSWK